MTENIFISDLHLSEQRPQTLALFLDYLRQRPQSGDALFILGDLFDAWVGDDDDADLAQQVKQAFRALTQSGVKLYIQRGNRDFLMGKRLMKETGATLLDDPHLMNIAGQPTLLMHGDLLCTDDLAYQKARKKLRNPLFQWLAMRKSLHSRREMAAEYRRRSGEVTAMTAANIMDANEQTILDYLNRFNATQMIHGHTHRPAVHQHQLDNQKKATRYVLDEWHDSGAAAWVDDGKSLRREIISTST